MTAGKRNIISGFLPFSYSKETRGVFFSSAFGLSSFPDSDKLATALEGGSAWYSILSLGTVFAVPNGAGGLLSCLGSSVSTSSASSLPDCAISLVNSAASSSLSFLRTGRTAAITSTLYRGMYGRSWVISCGSFSGSSFIQFVLRKATIMRAVSFASQTFNFVFLSR